MGKIKDEVSLKSMFGVLPWKRLKALIDPPCCEGNGRISIPCCPTELYTLSYDNVQCQTDLGVTTFTIDIVITLTTTLGVPVPLSFIFFTDSATIKSGDLGVILGIEGSTFSASPNALPIDISILKLVIFDIFGNYSNILEIQTNGICS